MLLATAESNAAQTADRRGTSFASPLAAGVAATLLQDVPTLSASQLRQMVLTNASAVTVGNGQGVANRVLFSKFHQSHGVHRRTHADAGRHLYVQRHCVGRDWQLHVSVVLEPRRQEFHRHRCHHVELHGVLLARSDVAAGCGRLWGTAGSFRAAGQHPVQPDVLGARNENAASEPSGAMNRSKSPPRSSRSTGAR